MLTGIPSAEKRAARKKAKEERRKLERGSDGESDVDEVSEDGMDESDVETEDSDDLVSWKLNIYIYLFAWMHVYTDVQKIFQDR